MSADIAVRRVTADLLREGGDEEGACALELVDQVVSLSHRVYRMDRSEKFRQLAFDVVAKIRPGWARVEMESHWDQAIRMNRP